MSNYVNKDNGFEQAETITRECPHCGSHAQLLPVSTPSFEALSTHRPRHVGIGFRCAACGEPRFGRVAVRAFSPTRVELSSNVIEVERPRERFQYHYLPDSVERVFREALQCYSFGCYNAFASMCRRTLQESITDMGNNARMRWYERFKDVVRIGPLDDATAHTLESILFGTESAIPELEADKAAVLIETIKDMVYQGYVRTAKLSAALKMRRYFAEEQTGKVTSIDDHRAESA